jgi:hypothetical protein
MRRHAIDRWADTTLFRLVLLFAGFAVVPVLLMGIAASLIGGGTLLAGQAAATLGIDEVLVALLSAAGALGFVGYVRAHVAVKDPCRHNLTTTLIFLGAGVLAALGVAGFVSAAVVASGLEPGGEALNGLLLGGLFAGANLVWVFAGIAWMQRLMRAYTERAGRAFDGLPVLLLSVSVVLAVAAALAAATL